MKSFLILLISFFLTNCSKPKTVLICGDHVCVNKAEAEQYFEENLSIEVKIIDKKKEQEVDLIELNLKDGISGKTEIIISKKINKDKKLKTLSKDEIIRIKRNVKVKKENNDLSKKNVFQNKSNTKGSLNQTNIKSNKDKILTNNVNKKKIKLVDVCTILEKCSIDEISKYLIKEGKKKSFPDITLKQ